MRVLVGKEAPVFTSQAVLASGEMTDDFHLGKFIAGKYASIFFYPLHFTFVCPSPTFSFSSLPQHLHTLLR